MIDFILGFIAWPLLGLIYNIISHYRVNKQVRETYSMFNWYWSFMGLGLIIIDIINYFKKDEQEWL